MIPTNPQVGIVIAQVHQRGLASLEYPLGKEDEKDGDGNRQDSGIFSKQQDLLLWVECSTGPTDALMGSRPVEQKGRQEATEGHTAVAEWGTYSFLRRQKVTKGALENFRWSIGRLAGSSQTLPGTTAISDGSFLAGLAPCSRPVSELVTSCYCYSSCANVRLRLRRRGNFWIEEIITPAILDWPSGWVRHSHR